MQLQRIRLWNFRAHAESAFEFEPGVNLIHGPNGIGKTNVLEAVHVACLAKSFLTHSDRHLVRRGSDHFRVQADFRGEGRRDRTVQVAYAPSGGKRVQVGGAPLDRLVDLIGQFPLVAISPDDHRLTTEGPDERRRLLNAVLCQASPAYLDDLMRYRRALRQRNGLLGTSRFLDPALLKPWNEALITHGSRILARRHEFLATFQQYLDDAFEALGGKTERPALSYRPGIRSAGSAGEWAESLRSALDEALERDVERGTTSRGPHRDEVRFTLDDMPLRHFGSQGQHRSFVMALRIAEHAYLKERTGKMPLLLLDDVFDNLDPNRIEMFLGYLDSDAVGQSIVTAARSDLFKAAPHIHHIALIEPPGKASE